MSVTVNDLMSPGVVVAQPDHTVEYVRRQMRTLEIHAIPVAEDDGTPIGLVQSRNLIADLDPAKPVREVMEKDVLTAERGTNVRLAAKILRQNRRNHLIITDAGAIVGILSSFDFLKLVEGVEFQDEEDAEDATFKTDVFDVPKT
ncbi:MAG: CBS domain-containing protein [Thermoanaerobaculia bacterium]|nr:CBS domain-containing protein [Thermoanaerobaculia bacterium]